jgi:hypothetical protein
MKKIHCSHPILLSTVFAMSSPLLAMNPALPYIPSGTFDITKYGAVADGSTDNAGAIQKAISAASAAGGGTVEVPAASKSYVCGPITLSSHVRLDVAQGATLAILAYGQYPLTGSSYTTWLTSKSANDMEISGRGTIDGQGQAWWDAFNANSSMPHRPYMINLQNGQRIHVHQITLKNSPMFHLALSNDNEVTIDSITILAPSTAPNTDAIDPSGVNYLIRDDSLAVGDDNIAIKAGSAFCKNFFISGCHFGTGHGLSVGGQSNDGLDSLSVTNCRFTGTSNGIRLKANRTNGGLSRHMLYTDLTMTNVQYPIYITSYYGTSSPSLTDPDSVITSLTPIWKDVVIANLTSTNTSSSATVGFFWGLPEMHLDSITLANVKISAPKAMVVTHADNLKILNSTLSPSSITANDASPAVSSPAFAMVSDPWPLVDSVGDTARFEVVATGTSALSYQWKKDGKALSNGGTVFGATSSILFIKGLAKADAGAYTVAVNNTSGSATSGAAALVVFGGTTSLEKISRAPQGVAGERFDIHGRPAGKDARFWIEFVPGAGWVKRIQQR